jgi:hypothetical protein
MTSLPPDAAGLGEDREQSGSPAEPDAKRPPAAAPPAALSRHDGTVWPGAPSGRRPAPARPSGAAVEFTLDLRKTPPDKVLSRLLGALERVAPDVTLNVLVRDWPDYVGVLANTHQTLRSRGYLTESSRLPAENPSKPEGIQRLRVQRRREPSRGSRGDAPSKDRSAANAALHGHGQSDAAPPELDAAPTSGGAVEGPGDLDA